MAGLNVTIRNAELDQFGTLVTHIALHTTDPGNGTTAATAEVSSARKPVAWNAASAGSKSNSAQIVVDVPASTTVAFLSYWSALTAGTYYGSRALSASETFTGAGTYTLAATTGIVETLS